MTFEQFQATRVASENLAAMLPDMPWDDAAQKATGYVYLDQLFIEDVKSYWPEKTKARGNFHLIIGNFEMIDFDLANLERHLFEYAKSEGFCD